MVAGALVGWLVTLLWPSRPAPSRPPAPARGTAELREYGVRLGLAGSVTAAIGFALDLDHKGWATTAALMVMRPAPELTRLRAAGRAAAVAIGAGAGCVLALLRPPSPVLAGAVILALTGLAATRTSRWYVTGGFTTFLVILVLAYSSPDQAESRFVERVAETLLGVAVALVLGVVVPRRRARRAVDPR